MILFLALTALFSAGLARLKLCRDPLASLYLQGHPFLPALEAIEKMAPEPALLIGILEAKGGDIYNQETVAKIDRVTKRLMSTEWVLPAGVTSLTKGFTHYETSANGMEMEPVLGRTWPRTPQDFEALKRKVAINPMGPGAYVAYDGSAAMITAPLADISAHAEQAYGQLPEAERARLSRSAYVARRHGEFLASLRRLVEELRSEEEDAGHRLLFMGPQLIEADLTAMGTFQLPVAASLTFLLVIVLLAAHFRNLQGVLVPLGCLVAPVLWSLGIYSLAGKAFNPMALLFPLVLGLISLVVGALAAGTYFRLYRDDQDKNLAITAAYATPSILAALTTAGLGILSLGITRVPLARDLGLLGLFWFLGAFAALFVLCPILHSLLPLQPAAKRGVRPGVSGRAATALARLAAGPGRTATLVLLAILLVAGAFAAARLPAGDNTPGYSYLRPDHPWNRCFSLLGRKFMGPFQLLVHARAREPGGLLDPEVLNAFGGLCDHARARAGARECIALDMMVELARRTLMDGNPKWQTIPWSPEQVSRLAGMVVEQGGVESFVDKTFTEATVSPFFPESDAGRIDQTAALLQAYLDSHPSDKVGFRLGGGLLGMTKAVNDAVREAYPKALAACFGIVLLLGAVTNRSVLPGLALSLSLAAAGAVVWLAMALTGTPVSLPLVPAQVAGVGLGAAFGLPLLRGRFPARRDPAAAPGETSLTEAAAEALFLGALFLAACLPWFFIGMKFQSQMVLAAGVLAPLEALACVIFIPALGRSLESRIRTRAGR